MLNGLDLFSGYGGITLALEGYTVPSAYCEIEQYAQKILLSRMSEGKLPVAPIWDDVTTLSSEHIPTEIGIIYGGFPCQDLSVAGRGKDFGKGLEGKRSGLFYEVCRLVKEINPKFVFLENVPTIRTKGLREVVREFAVLGYDCRWTCMSAKEIGAPHLRKRWFLLAHSEHDGRDESEILASDGENVQWPPEGEEKAVKPKGGDTQRVLSTDKTIRPYDPWILESGVDRTTDGCPDRLDRIKSLGNGVVPQQARKAFEKLAGL